MKNILIAIDLQNDFIDGALGTKEAVEITDNAARKIEAFDGDIIVTYDTHTQNYMDTQEGKYLPIPHCIKGTEGWKLNAKIQTALSKKQYTEIQKPTFGSTELIEFIKKTYKPEQINITLIGLCTDICVVSNALLLKANFTETSVSVDSSCCAGVTPQSHAAAITTMKMCQINVI